MCGPFSLIFMSAQSELCESQVTQEQPPAAWTWLCSWDRLGSTHRAKEE